MGARTKRGQLGTRLSLLAIWNLGCRFRLCLPDRPCPGMPLAWPPTSGPADERLAEAARADSLVWLLAPGLPAQLVAPPRVARLIGCSRNGHQSPWLGQKRGHLLHL